VAVTTLSKCLTNESTLAPVHTRILRRNVYDVICSNVSYLCLLPKNGNIRPCGHGLSGRDAARPNRREKFWITPRRNNRRIRGTAWKPSKASAKTVALTGENTITPSTETGAKTACSAGAPINATASPTIRRSSYCVGSIDPIRNIHGRVPRSIPGGARRLYCQCQPARPPVPQTILCVFR
jgi:hypothetical protein